MKSTAASSVRPAFVGPHAFPRLAALSPGDRFHLLFTAFALATALVWLAGYLFWGLSIEARAAWPTLAMLFTVLVVAAQYRWRVEPRLFNLLMMVFWIILVTNGHFFPMYMAARTDVPLSDAWLARCDQAMGLEVSTVRAWMAQRPALDAALLEIYKTLIPLMTVATIVPPLVHRPDRSKRFVLACVIAACIALPIFARVQAVGPWEYYRFDPLIPSLANKASMLAQLKSPNPFLVDLANRDGLITFPSFHVVLTALAAATLWPLKWLRWPITAWAALIIASTVTTGIHYSIDVVGGLAVAAIAWCLAGWIFRVANLAEPVGGLPTA